MISISRIVLVLLPLTWNTVVVVVVLGVLLCNRLDVYIHDYLVKRDLKATAQAFQAEGKVSSDPVGEYCLICLV